LENSGLTGLQFFEAVLKGNSTKAAKHPFWELKASAALPKMVNSILIAERGTHGIYDPPYRNGEPHYRQSELKSLGNFDIAYTFESGSANYPDHMLVASQKFYQCCLQNEIPLEVVPVRIDIE